MKENKMVTQRGVECAERIIEQVIHEYQNTGKNEASYRIVPQLVAAHVAQETREQTERAERAENEACLLASDVLALREAKDGAYAERNHLVAALSKLFPAGTKRTEIEGWDKDWENCIYIDLPTGQVSWHIHDSEMPQFTHLGPYYGIYDGHNTPQKYRRLAALANTAKGDVTNGK